MLGRAGAPAQVLVTAEQDCRHHELVTWATFRICKRSSRLPHWVVVCIHWGNVRKGFGTVSGPWEEPSVSGVVIRVTGAKKC